jgi:uncharacterized protein with NRDE domain
MCITFIYINNEAAADEAFHLIVAFNRDEYYNRPTLPAHFWNDHCISGEFLCFFSDRIISAPYSNQWLQLSAQRTLKKT